MGIKERAVQRFSYTLRLSSLLVVYIMETYYSSLPLPSSMDYPGLQGSVSSSLPLPPSLHKADSSIVSDRTNLITNSILMSHGMEGSIHSEDAPITSNSWTASTSVAAAYPNPYQQNLTTPPPENNNFHPTYSSFQSWQTYGIAPNQVVAASCMAQPISTGTQSYVYGDPYVRGSSLEESPLSSPSSCEGTTQDPEDAAFLHTQALGSATHVPASHCNGIYGMTATGGYEYVMAPAFAQGMVHLDSQEHYELGMQVPKGVKMPQRKGGIQLWQFLYSLLTSNESKHREIIEWTANVHEREFRMLEPESIAVWWGHHKNKPNMSYDKFSRSLRYYYDKGILKKIPGERYVYRFLIDPEHMYRHIGTSDCRPKLKPMPQAAKVAMSKYQHDSSIDFKANSLPIVTQEPVPLEKTFSSESSRIKQEQSDEVKIDDVSKSRDKLFPLESVIQNSSSTGNLLEIEPRNSTGSLSMKRSRSLECASNYSEHSPTEEVNTSTADTISCPPTLRNSYESFTALTTSTSYSNTYSSASNGDSSSALGANQKNDSRFAQPASNVDNTTQFHSSEHLFFSQSKSNNFMEFSPGQY